MIQTIYIKKDLLRQRLMKFCRISVSIFTMYRVEFEFFLWTSWFSHKELPVKVHLCSSYKKHSISFTELWVYFVYPIILLLIFFFCPFCWRFWFPFHSFAFSLHEKLIGFLFSGLTLNKVESGNNPEFYYENFRLCLITYKYRK